MIYLRVFESFAILLLLSYPSSTLSSSASHQTTIPPKSSNVDKLASSASAPHSITRLHQIWTSTSSDRLDELSPDLISKMKADVPFLEAYALRPRLVGASGSSIQPLTTGNYLAKQQHADAGVEPSNRRASYLSSPGFLGFSELKMESASSSKTEHHHKRTTSLKKRADEHADEVTLRGADKSKQVKRLIRKLASATSSRNPERRRKGKRASYGALYQDTATEANLFTGNRLEPEEGQVKGGSTGGKREPFYANAEPDGEKLDGEAEVEPARVGDEDVDEEGDTEMVEPKSDGVADDPELADYEDSGADEGTGAGGRVNRAGSHDGAVSDEDDDDESGSRDGDTAGGGAGLGASAGSPPAGDAAGSTGGPVVTPGVERADGDFLDDGGAGDRKKAKEEPKSLGEDSDEKEDKSEPENELEYRDDDDDDDQDSSESPGDAEAGNEGRRPAKEAGSRQEEEEHRGEKGSPQRDEDNDEHHQHQSAIECLEDAVPGEPGLDYPILSRVNSSRFQCSQYNYPGYYADTEARCQVFHYCAPDGTQDSFLCPNGTIFSQKTSVCVWWNTFQCEASQQEMHCNSASSSCSRLVYRSTLAAAALGSFLFLGSISNILAASSNQQPTSASASNRSLLSPTPKLLAPPPDAAKYVGLNALLYKQQRLQQQHATDTHSIDGLIEAMKRRSKDKQPDDNTKTSPNSDIDGDAEAEAADVPLGHSHGRKTSSPKQQPASVFDETAAQRKSAVPDEAHHDHDLADAEARRARAARRLSSRSTANQWKASNNNNNNNFLGAAPRRMRRASARQAPPKLRSSSRRYMRPSRRVAYRIKNVSKPRRRS